MEKRFRSYAMVWAILLVIYNLTVFLVKPIIPGYVINYDARFWISWSVIVASYIGQLFCSKVAFASKNHKKLFLNIPLIAQSYTALIVVTIAGTVLMLIPDCPAWIAAIICAAALGFSVISVIKAIVAAEIVGEIDDKVKAQTSFIKTLTADAESLMSRAKSEAVKAECKKVYEAIRYSDPMSNVALTSVEDQITVKFAELSSAMAMDDAPATSALAEEVLTLLRERNNKCKLLK